MQIWFFRPGNVNGARGPVPGNFANSFIQVSAIAGNPADGIISPRAHSTHGIYGDNLFVFGGIATVNGADATMNDLWIFRLPAQQWLKVGGNTAGQPWPMPLANSRPAGVIIGRWMYVMIAPADPAAGSSQLWRWTFPVYPSGGGGGGGGGGGNNNNNGANSAGAAIATGHTAGIVVGLLIGLANLALLVAIFRGGSGSSFSSTRLSAVTASGFYTSQPAGAAASAGGYTAPEA